MNTSILIWFESYLQYANYCAANEFSTIVCKPFWTAVVYLCLGVGIIVISRNIWLTWIWYRNAQRVKKRKLEREAINAEEISRNRWVGEDSDILDNMSEAELATQFRNSIYNKTPRKGSFS